MLFKKGGVVSVVHSRGLCKPLRSVFLPLQIARSFTCSVASLGQSPHHYLPGLHSFRYGALADYLLGQGRPSTCPTGLAEVPDTTSPIPTWAIGGREPPDNMLHPLGVWRCWVPKYPQKFRKSH